MRRVKYSPAAVFLLTNIAYLYILATVNSEISPYASLILPSVFIIGPALMLRGWQAALVIGLTAFLCEATTPVRPGITCALWLLAAVFVRIARFRFRSLDPLSLCALAQFVNLALGLAYMLFFPNGCANLADYLFRVFADLLLSAAVLVLIARFSVLVPLSILKFAGIKLKIEEDD